MDTELLNEIYHRQALMHKHVAEKLKELSLQLAAMDKLMGAPALKAIASMVPYETIVQEDCSLIEPYTALATPVEKGC